MVAAKVILGQFPDCIIEKQVDAGKDGAYEIEVQKSGPWMLRFLGLYHRDYYVALYLEKEKAIHLDVRLQASNFRKDFDQVGMVSKLNLWYAPNAIKLKKQGNGKYSGEFDTKEDTVVYKLINVCWDGPVAGTQAERYVWNEKQGYCSVVSARNGKVNVVFDPREFPSYGKRYGITLDDSLSRVSKFTLYADYFQKSIDRNDSLYFVAVYERKQSETYDWSPTKEYIAKCISSETDTALRKQLRMIEMMIAVRNRVGDPKYYTSMLKDIDPVSPFWILYPHNLQYALTHSNLSKEKQEEFVECVLKNNQNRRIKSILLYDMFMISKFSENMEKTAYYYKLLVNQYADTPEGKEAREQFPYQFENVIGESALPFSVPLMDDSTKIITNDFFRGKYCLIDFWASWSPTCMNDMKVLYALFELYEKKLQIFSLSMDSSSQAVIQFRKTKWEMPWMNAFLGGEYHPLARKYHVIGVPERILIDPKGIVVAKGKDLTGQNLEATLKKYIGK